MFDGLKETLTGTERIYEGRMINLRRDTVKLPNGNTSTREVIEHPGAIAVVPILPDGRIVLVRQFRHPVADILLEIPAGKLSPGEDPDLCAHRELEEETGYVSGKMQKMTSIFTAPGFTDEVIHIYLAGDLRPTKQQTDEDEFIEVEMYSSSEVIEMIRTSQIRDAKTIAGFLMSLTWPQ